jgi:hypothetical protein
MSGSAPAVRSVGGVTGRASPKGGSKTSIGRLQHLDFDPITELVLTYRKIQAEVERQEEIRDNILVELSTSGKPKAYRPEVHHALFDKLINVGEKLLRYRYGRVPENVEEGRKQAAALVINLTKKGEVYRINDDGDMPDADQQDVFEDDPA